MPKVYKYNMFFEKKEEKKTEKPAEKPAAEKPEKKAKKGEQLFLFPEEEVLKEKPKKKTYGMPSLDWGDMGPDAPDFLKKGKKDKKKIKKSELEKHPFFKYIPTDLFKKLIGKKDTEDTAVQAQPDVEISEEDIVYDIDELPIQQGDYVICQEFDDLNTNQVEFLNAKPMHKVRSVCDKNGRYYSSGEPHIDLGYKIPFKMKRFIKVDRNVEGRYKILFFQFDLPIDLHGEKDSHDFFKGKDKMSDLFEVLFREKLPSAFVDFCNYDDVYRTGEDFYVEGIKLRDYDFVFFGFMSNFTTIVKMLISYLDDHGVPYLKYGTYKDYDNKAWEMHLLQSLGYPYIPSVMASKLTKHVMDKIKEWGYPVIVKDINLNRGEGVWKVEDKKELAKHFLYGSRIMLIQKFLPNDGDYRVISIKNKVELVIKKERVSGSKEFRANVARGGKAVKGSLPLDIIKMCEDISRHLVCDIVGFDIIQDLSTGEYYVMETNSSPHFPTFSVISEIDIPGILTDYIIKTVKDNK